MRKLKLALVGVCTLALSGCFSTRESVGIASGAVVGGLIGSALTRPAYAPTPRVVYRDRYAQPATRSVVVQRGYAYRAPYSRTVRTDYYNDD